METEKKHTDIKLQQTERDLSNLQQISSEKVTFFSFSVMFLLNNLRLILCDMVYSVLYVG